MLNKCPHGLLDVGLYNFCWWNTRFLFFELLSGGDGMDAIKLFCSIIMDLWRMTAFVGIDCPWGSPLCLVSC